MFTGRWAQDMGPQRAEDFLRDARAHERAGCMAEAMRSYESAIDAAGREGERRILAESLRRLGVVHRYRDEPDRAREL